MGEEGLVSVRVVVREKGHTFVPKHTVGVCGEEYHVKCHRYNREATNSVSRTNTKCQEQVVNDREMISRRVGCYSTACYSM